jgi:hypothetical protein
MTRKEYSNDRDLTFSKWIRENLPDSTSGFMVSDIDFFIYNFKTKKAMILEVKTRGADVKTWQKIMYKNINRWIKKGIDNDWQWLGVHLLQFENTYFNNGKVWFDREETTEQKVIKLLSLIY